MKKKIDKKKWEEILAEVKNNIDVYKRQGLTISRFSSPAMVL